ncbi:MAG: hypothetical protein A4S09_07465 [Proteobacteria bacterium SG_bin7]|nr:MAG: hypothetical protein A4S09_07465 [Proteobacteria bacterium SG_bin7]
MRKFATFAVSVSIIGSVAKTEPYCLALRGNGEAQPAHWGALANVVERFGLPEVQSGGSSAAISLMLLESIASNPWVANATDEQQKSRAAFLLKVLHGITIYFSKKIKNKIDKSGLDIQKLFTAKANDLQIDSLSEVIKSPIPDSITSRLAQTEVVNTLYALGINESSRYFFLFKKLLDLQKGIKLEAHEIPRIRFYAEDLRRTLLTFGSFDAESDPAIFFREGIINFERLGFGMGKIATYLSGKYSTSVSTEAFNRLISLCEHRHKGLTWKELVSQEGDCQSYLNASLESYFFGQTLVWENVNFAKQPVGNVIPSIPTTAVLINSAFTQAKDAMEAYHASLDRKVAENFKVQNIKDVRLGYWGSPSWLNKIFLNLDRRDAKSSMFLGLGRAENWLEVLRASPAEPGLANLQPMKVNGKEAFSAGGWSDLHPVLVLKATGVCQNVVYVTRQGGESLFAQGIAKRLLNLDRKWEFLSTKDKTTKEKNAQLNDVGDVGDKKSLWSRLYNLANPLSSFKKSLSKADAVLCTNWNDFDVRNQLDELVEDSYRSELSKFVNKPGCH